MVEQTLAARYYEAWFAFVNAEDALDAAVLRAVGADPDETDTWPCGHLVYDWYDASFELRGTRDDFVPTEAQILAVLALGFAQGWICYTDGTEVFLSHKTRGDRVMRGRHGGASEAKRVERQRRCPKCRSEVARPGLRTAGVGD